MYNLAAAALAQVGPATAGRRGRETPVAARRGKAARQARSLQRIIVGRMAEPRPRRHSGSAPSGWAYSSTHLCGALPASCCQVLPRLGQLVAQWAPLDAPALPAAEFATWRPLLEGEGAAQASVLAGAAGGTDGSDPYMRLVAELLLPPLRKELTNSWDPRWTPLPAAAAAPAPTPQRTGCGTPACNAAARHATFPHAAPRHANPSAHTLPPHTSHPPTQTPPTHTAPAFAGTPPGWSVSSRCGSRCCRQARCSTSWSRWYCRGYGWRYRRGTRCATPWRCTPGCIPGW